MITIGEKMLIRDFIKASLELSDFREHQPYCVYSRTEFCDCGLRGSNNKFQKTLKSLKAIL